MAGYNVVWLSMHVLVVLGANFGLLYKSWDSVLRIDDRSKLDINQVVTS